MNFFRILLFFPFFTYVFSTLQAQGFTSIERYTDLSELHSVHGIVVDKEDNKYVATADGLYKIQYTSGVLETIESGFAVTAVAWDNKSGLWAVKNDNTVYQPGTDHSFSFDEKGLKITCLDASVSRLYVGTNIGMFEVKLTEDALERRKTKESKLLAQTPINTIFVDPSRVRWIGTDNGVFRMENNKVNLYEKKSRITAITYTSEGVWIVGDDEMWLVDNYNRWAPAAVERGLSSGTVGALASDKRGQVYLASDVLVQFNPYSDDAYTLDESYGFVNSQSTALVCDKQDQVWVGTADKGLFKIKIKTEKPVELSAVIAKTNVLKCHDDRDASLKLIVNGAQGPFDFNWEGIESEELELFDLGPGEYFVIVSDTTGKTFKTSTIVKAPAQIEIELLLSTPTQFGRKKGTASLKINGGTEPYEIKWSAGQTGITAERLTVGKHLVTVVDKNGCVGSQEIEIEEEKVLAGLSVDKLKVGTTLNIEQLFFAADSSRIKSESFSVLNEIDEFLTSNNQIVIEIGGHTNNVPEHEYCDRLSTARAKSVAEYLYQKGIDQTRIAFKGYGKRNPVATNATREGRRKNQRVEIKILSLGG